MAEPQSGSVSSIKSRIAALNLEEVHGPAPGARPSYSYEQATAKKKAPPPPPPSARPPGLRQQSVNNPPVLSNATSTTARQTGNQPIQAAPPTPKVSPALPPRLPPRSNTAGSPQQPPSLPPRRPTEPSLRRRDSNESVSTVASGLSIGSAKTSFSTVSNGGTMYQVRAPAFDPSKLPPLPPKKAPEEPKGRATLKAMKSASNVVNADKKLPPQLPARPPLPARKSTSSQNQIHQEEEEQPRTDFAPRRSALSFGMNKATETPPPLPTSRPSTTDSGTGPPPPIPMGSRPNLQAIMASKPKPGATGSCLKCREFSGPDNHAARFPRQTLPSSNVGWLASQLTSPFPSATDKARAIFTWLHHNVEYDVHSFFGGTVSGSTPERTITTGLAVCEGYASLFAALALKSGLEAIVVGGNGKGYGHKALRPGEPLPPFNPSGHAWNAVRIDNGEWKLLDACWGAGNVKGPGEPYQKDFKAYWFTMDNNEFGIKHYPQDNAYFFRTDGRATIPWEEYCHNDMGEKLTVYSAATPDHGIGEQTFQPSEKHLRVHDPQTPVIRFQFATICPHWDNERHGKGKPYVMVLHIGGRDGRKTEWVPFQTDGKVWWLDVNRSDLGAPGQKVSVFAVTSIDGRDGRGVTYAQYQQKKGKVAMGFGGVAMWELV